MLYDKIRIILYSYEQAQQTSYTSQKSERKNYGAEEKGKDC